MPDSTTSYLQNKTFVDLDERGGGPEAALPEQRLRGHVADPSQFSNIPGVGLPPARAQGQSSE